MQNLLLKLINNDYFKQYYDKKPKNINDLYIMVDKVKNYLQENEKIQR